MTTPRTIRLQHEPDWASPPHGCGPSYAVCDDGLLCRPWSSEKIYQLWRWEDMSLGFLPWTQVHLEVTANEHLDDIPSQQKDRVMDEIKKLRNEIQRNNTPRKWSTLIVDDVLPVLCGAIAGALIAILWSI